MICGMEKYFSPFLSAYRKNFSSQNILMSLPGEWRKNLENNFVVVAVLMTYLILLTVYHKICGKSDKTLSYIYSHLPDHS